MFGKKATQVIVDDLLITFTKFSGKDCDIYLPNNDPRARRDVMRYLMPKYQFVEMDEIVTWYGTWTLKIPKGSLISKPGHDDPTLIVWWPHGPKTTYRFKGASQ